MDNQKDSICTLCKRAESHLANLRQHFARLQQELELTRTNIIAAQAVLATTQALNGETYDHNTVPFDLD